MTLPPIYFYVPQRHWPANLPEDPDLFWQWQAARGKSNLGIYDIPLQAYLHLKKTGFPCELVSTLPDRGIVFAHRFWFHDHQQPGSKLLMVCIRGDRPRHPYAQLHIVQNPCQEKTQGFLTYWESYYIPHWRQSGLIHRETSRGDRFENIAYFGYDVNLVPEMKAPEWSHQLEAIGLNWHVIDQPSLWHDYSYVDAVVAMRCFGNKVDFSWKPATKLYQAWAAKVPAILGYESGFRAERKNELDYLEATSTDEIIAALKRLQDNPELRRAMIENGLVRAAETNPQQLINRWRKFITDIAVPTYERWCNASDLSRQNFLKRRYLAVKFNKIQERLGLLAVPEIDKLRIN